VPAPPLSRAVLLMARAPRAGTVRRALEPLLGPERCAALQAALISRAARWAGDVAPGAVHVGYEPVDAEGEMRALLGPEVSLFPQHGNGISGRLAQATARLFARGHGPVLIIWPDLPEWRPIHASSALADLEDGADLALGPQFDGGFYMVGIARPLAALMSLPEGVWRSPDAMSAAIVAAREAELEVGLLRAERGLRRPEDVRAALADPLTDPEIRAILS
jgi:glycosyltransferase A (GT-A) superfamily protein (DUF2064 family)